MNPDTDITELLAQWRDGDENARELLFKHAYEQLRQIAHRMLSADRQRFVIQPTELVNECSLRLFGINRLDWKDRAHFVAVATTTMRRVLVDQARRGRAEKRDGLEITLATGQMGTGGDDLDIEAVDEALTRLKSISEQKARIVELKFFGGLTDKEIGEVMQMSISSVTRSWRSSRAWLYAELVR